LSGALVNYDDDDDDDPGEKFLLLYIDRPAIYTWKTNVKTTTHLIFEHWRK